MTSTLTNLGIVGALVLSFALGIFFAIEPGEYLRVVEIQSTASRDPYFRQFLLNESHTCDPCKLDFPAELPGERVCCPGQLDG